MTSIGELLHAPLRSELFEGLLSVPPLCGIKKDVSNRTTGRVCVFLPPLPKEWRCRRSTITFWNIILISEKMFFCSHSLHRDTERKVGKNNFWRCAVSASPLHKYSQEYSHGQGIEQMTSTIYKRRSINLDDRTYTRGKLLAKSQTVSLSALLRLLINRAYEQFPGIARQQDGSRSC